MKKVGSFNSTEPSEDIFKQSFSILLRLPKELITRHSEFISESYKSKLYMVLEPEQVQVDVKKLFRQPYF